MLGLLLQAGCGALTGFACTEDAACRNDGVCTEVGACAYPDPNCPSGLRFSSVSADEFAGRCVEPESDVTSSLSATDPSTSSSTADETVGESSESSSTGPPPAVCGDGLIEQEEECDPPTDGIEAPRCNESCTLSGKRIDEFFAAYPGNDVGYAVAIWDGDVAVGGYVTWEDGNGADIHVSRHAGNDLRQVREYRRSGASMSTDVARGLAATDDGTLLVAGYVRVPNAMAAARDQIWVAELDAGLMATWEGEFGDVELNEHAFALARIDATDFAIAARSDGAFVVERYSAATDEPVLVWSQPVEGAGGGSDSAFAVALDVDAVFAGGSLYTTKTNLDSYLSSWSVLDGVATGITCDVGPPTRPADAPDEIFGVAVRPDGRVVAVGRAQPGDDQDAWIGVYEPDTCAPWWQRSVDGGAGGSDRWAAVAVDAEGNIFTVGWTENMNTDDTWIAKWDGSVVDTMVWNERWNGNLDGDDRMNAVVIDQIGRVVVAGQTQGNGADIWIARYSP